MRGALVNEVAKGVGAGIIPAYAGSTATHSRDKARRQDHPRVCGEHARIHGAWYESAGSSPRMRGAPSGRPGTSTSWGIIPAYAGSTK